MAYWSPMKKFYDARVVEVPRRKFINFIVNFIVNFSVFLSSVRGYVRHHSK